MHRNTCGNGIDFFCPEHFLQQVVEGNQTVDQNLIKDAKLDKHESDLIANISTSVEVVFSSPESTRNLEI